MLNTACPTWSDLAARVSVVHGLDGFLQLLEGDSYHQLAQVVGQNYQVLLLENFVEYVVDEVLSVLVITTLSKEVFGSAQNVCSTQVLISLPKGIEIVQTLMILLVIRKFVHQSCAACIPRDDSFTHDIFEQVLLNPFIDRCI